MERSPRHPHERDREPSLPLEEPSRCVHHVLDDGEAGAGGNAEEQGLRARLRPAEDRSERFERLLGEGGDDGVLHDDHDRPARRERSDHAAVEANLLGEVLEASDERRNECRGDRGEDSMECDHQDGDPDAPDEE